MENIQQWLDRQLTAYQEKPEETLVMRLENTQHFIQLYFNNPDSMAVKMLLVRCFKHNALLLNAIGTDLIQTD